MLSPSDFNSAVPQFTNGDYASNPINPQYIAEPDAVDYNRGAEPLKTLPAQWWNWFLNKFTARFNKVNIYVKNIFNELTQLLSLVSVTPSGTEKTPTVGQLKDMFENKYPSYLALLMYPIGSIYWTGKAPDDGGDPNELFGGTWVQIKNCFIWAKGNNDALNATGGSKTVTLTEQQIPSHTHTFTGSAVTSGANSRGHTHSVTASGSVSVTTNPTFTGTAVTSGAMSGNSEGKFGAGIMTSYGSFTTSGNVTKGSAVYSIGLGGGGSNTQGFQHTINVAHTHSVTAKGSISGGAYSFTGSAVTSGAESQNHTHSVTARGTNSSTGGGKAHDNMPPYIVKYCWERTA